MTHDMQPSLTATGQPTPRQYAPSIETNPAMHLVGASPNMVLEIFPPELQGEVSVQVRHLEDKITRIGKALEELEKRLSPILLESRNKDVIPPKEGKERSPAAVALEMLDVRAERIGNRIDDLLTRIDL